MQGASAEVTLKTGEMIKITVDDNYKEQCSEEILWVDYKNIIKVVDVDNRIFIDDGLISVVVREKGRAFVFVSFLACL